MFHNLFAKNDEFSGQSDVTVKSEKKNFFTSNYSYHHIKIFFFFARKQILFVEPPTTLWWQEPSDYDVVGGSTSKGV